MADKAKVSGRESALVSILERVVGQLRKQDQMLEDLAARQLELSAAVERVELGARSRQFDPEAAIGKLQDSFSRYRSDMLSLVNEQDHINKNLTSLNNLINKTTYALENINQKLAGLEERLKVQEKASGEHYTHSLKQAEILPKEIADSNRSVTKLHMDTEKSLATLHQETQRQLGKLQQETTRRLLALDGIESALQTLLVRTQPPERKPFWFVRVFRKVVGFFNKRLSKLFGKNRRKV